MQALCRPIRTLPTCMAGSTICNCFTRNERVKNNLTNTVIIEPLQGDFICLHDAFSYHSSIISHVLLCTQTL